MHRFHQFALLALLSGSLLTGCAGTAASADPNGQAPASEKPVYYLAGKIQAAQGADLSVPFIGRVTEVFVTPGQTVAAGDPLVAFDPSEAAASEAVARQGLETALANLAKAEAGARPEQLHQAQASQEAATVAFNNAKSNLQRQQALFDAGALSAAALETAQGQSASAESAYQNATEAYAILKNGETAAYLNILKKQAEQAQASVDAAAAVLANRTVRAPFTGTIVACPAKAGETYLYQAPLVSIENRERLTLEAYGPASAAAHFKAGEAVLARVAEVPDKTYEGTVVWVSETVDPKRRDVLVRISLDPQAELMAGMFAEIAPKE